MLIGEYQHTFDDKSRISLPAKFRKEMGQSVVIAPGIDNCLFVFTMKGWKDFTERLSSSESSSSVLQADNRNFNRLIIGRAVEVDVDGTGRMLIPDHLREYAGLLGPASKSKSMPVSAGHDNDKEPVRATIIGVMNRLEVWNSEAWVSYRGAYEKKTEEMAERLAQAGIL